MNRLKSFINRIYLIKRKNTIGLSKNIDKSYYSLLEPSFSKLNTKADKFYVGSDFSFVDDKHTVNYWLEAKNREELILEKKKESFFERVSKLLDSLNSNLTVELSSDDISEYSEEELIALIQNWNLDIYSYTKLSQHYSDIKNSKRLIRSFENQINTILGNIRKLLRNFKEIYKKQHSFILKI